MIGADPVGSGQSLIPGRLVSLDAFRGITIAGMILVNNPGSWSFVYAPLRHAEWHGWTPTDLIFPFFLFIVGVSMTLSFSKQRERGLSERELHLKVLKRALLIFAIGLFLNAFPRFDLAALRIFGVLQRIALAYLFASLITLRSGSTGQIRWAGGLLIFYWVVMKVVPVPGFGAGDLSMEGNLAAWIDRSLFGAHLWRDLYDPEGLLSTIPAVATVLLGVLTGRLIHSDRPQADIVNRLFVWGWGCILAGLIVGIWFPINKALWTSSYVLFTAGAAMQFLGVCFWLIEVKGIRRWALPAIEFGMNPLAIFVGSGLLVKTLILIKVAGPDGGRTSLYAWIYNTLFVPVAGPMNGSLLFALGNVLFWFMVATLLYRRHIFIKI
ncbi:acyltransferase family protein [Candidatus Zixiibacteriota bacterium]